MIRKRRLIVNTALLTGSSLLMSCIGMAFQVWLVGRIGEAGIGLYQLVLSVSFLCATVAISGIRFAATRLISEELGRENPGGVRSAMLRCVAYALFFGLASGLVLWLLAEPVGFLCIGDARTVRSLRISALGMPCISLCAAFSGYFTACGRVWKPTFIHFAEQLAGIALVTYFLRAVPGGEIERSCAAVTFGRLLADVLSTVLMLVFYLADRRSYYNAETNNSHLTGRMLKIALPLAASAYARSALNTMQHLLVPRGLRAAGFSADRALAGYGIIQGMVLPILGFPACLMSALAELIVPELTEAQVQRDNAGIARAIRSLLKMSLLFSGGAALFMFVFSDKLGLVIYSSAEAGRYIRILAPLIPVMYTDMTVDGCLKGLGQQVWSMGINIAEALLGLLLVWRLLPVYALAAYIGVIYFSEIFNFSLSCLRLKRVFPAA